MYRHKHTHIHSSLAAQIQKDLHSRNRPIQAYTGHNAQPYTDIHITQYTQEYTSIHKHTQRFRDKTRHAQTYTTILIKT